MTSRRLVTVVAAWMLALTACGSRVDPSALEAANGKLQVASSSGEPGAGTPAAVSAPTDAGSSARPAEPGAVVRPGAGVGAVEAGAPSGAGQAGGAVPSAGASPRSSAAGSAAVPLASEPAPASGQVVPDPGAGPAPTTPAGTLSDVVLGSIGVEAGILGAVTGPTPPAIRAWASQLNARGGLAGHRVRVVLADDGNDPARAQALVRQLVEQDKVIAFINEYTLNTLGAVMPYLEERQIPVIGSIGGDFVGGASPMMFNPLAGSFGTSQAWAALLTINAMSEHNKVGLVYCREVNGCTTYAQTMKKLLPYGDLNIVYEAQVSLAQPDYTAEMIQAQQAGAEVVFVLLDSSAIVRVARSAHRQGYEPTLAAAFNASHDVILSGGEDVEGLLVGGRYASWDSSPLVQDYRDAMAAYQPSAPKGDLGGGVFVVGRLIEEKIGPFLREPPASAQFLEGLFALDRETLGGRLPGISFPREGSREKVNLCTVPQKLVNGKFTTRDAAASFVCAPGWTPVPRG
ncbi:MAG: ABC transporter substrate-binding protein [Acidimicrobiia bacterium]